MRKFSYLFLSLLLVVSCSQETLENEDNMAFSSDSDCSGPKPVGTGEFLQTNNTIAGEMPDDVFDFVADIYGKVHRAVEDVDANGKKYFQLGFIVTENSQNPGFVYVKKAPADGSGIAQWEKLNPCRGSMISGFWDGLSKNESVNARIIQEGTNKNKVYLFFGLGKVNKFKMFRVDNGEVLKAHNQPVRTLKGNIGSASLFFHDAQRADFPPNWLGVKGKKLYSFGTNIRNTPELIPVRQGGFDGADLNNNIRRVQGANSAFVKRIDIERINGTVFTVQKERKNGINFYKD